MEVQPAGIKPKLEAGIRWLPVSMDIYISHGVACDVVSYILMPCHDVSRVSTAFNAILQILYIDSSQPC